MRGVLTIALLLRLMDSFMIYTEPFVLTGGGPGTATTFLSQYLTQKAVGQFDLGPAAAFSLVYFLIILLLCFVLYNFMKEADAMRAAAGHEHHEARLPGRALLLALYLVFTLAPIYWMVHMSLRSNQAITGTFAWLPESLSLANYATIFTDPAWYGGYVNSIIYVVLNTVLSVAVALPAAYAFSRYSFHRRQAPVLLAADQPHDAARGVPAAVLPAVHRDRPDGHAPRGRARAHGVQRAARGVDPRRIHVGRAARDRRDGVHRRLFVPALLRASCSCR